MSSTERHVACRFPGCAHAAMACEPAGPSLCEGHLALAAPAQRRRLQSAQRRAKFIASLWADSARYDAIVASGRYLKLVHAGHCAEDALGAAVERVVLSVYAYAGSSEGRWLESA